MMDDSDTDILRTWKWFKSQVGQMFHLRNNDCNTVNHRESCAHMT